MLTLNHIENGGVNRLKLEKKGSARCIPASYCGVSHFYLAQN